MYAERHQAPVSPQPVELSCAPTRLRTHHQCSQPFSAKSRSKGIAKHSDSSPSNPIFGSQKPLQLPNADFERIHRMTLAKTCRQPVPGNPDQNSLPEGEGSSEQPLVPRV